MSLANAGGDPLTSTGTPVPQGESSPTTTLQGHRPINVSNPAESDSSEEPKASTTPDHLPRKDVLIIDWDGPNDPQRPTNWSRKQKWTVTLIVSSYTFISPVSSSMIAPASAQVAEELGISSSAMISLVTSIFVLAYAIGPFFLGPLSEIYGRSRVLQLANLWYLAWNLGCGFATSEGQLMAFRFLAGLGGSAPLAIGGGVLADCWRPEERGQAVALFSLAPLLGPVIGPIAGAWIADRSTWKWVFWSTSIVDAAIQVVGTFLLQETYAPVLLERKAKKIRRSMDDERATYQDVRTVFEGEERSWRTLMSKSLVRPFALFGREPIIQLLGLYMAYLYGMLYIFLVTIPSIFEGIYKQPVGIAGLNYIALGVGQTGASQINARLLDRIYIYLMNKNGAVGRPEFRLPGMFLGTILFPIGLFISRWAARSDILWIAPDIGIALVGAGAIINFQCVQTYVVDAFTLHAASAMAAVSCLRSLAGFGFPLFAPAMYSALGFGKGDTMLAVVAIVIGCPAPWIFWMYGERIRKSSQYAR